MNGTFKTSCIIVWARQSPEGKHCVLVATPPFHKNTLISNGFICRQWHYFCFSIPHTKRNWNMMLCQQILQLSSLHGSSALLDSSDHSSWNGNNPVSVVEPMCLLKLHLFLSPSSKRWLTDWLTDWFDLQPFGYVI